MFDMSKTSTPSGNPAMGERGRKRREELGIEKNAFALELGVGTNRINQMEQNGVETLSALERWATALRMSPAELAWGNAPKKGTKAS